MPVVGVESDFWVHDRVIYPCELGFDAVVFGEDDFGEECLVAQAFLCAVGGLVELPAVGVPWRLIGNAMKSPMMIRWALPPQWSSGETPPASAPSSPGPNPVRPQQGHSS